MSPVDEIVKLRYLGQNIYQLNIQPTEKEFQEYTFLRNKYSGSDIAGILIDQCLTKDKIIKQLREQRNDFIDRYAEYKRKKNVGAVIAEIQYNCDRELEFIK